MSDSGNQPPTSLRRELGLIDAVGIGLGAIVGAGIFVVTGVAAGVAGPAFLIGLVIAGLAATCNALSSAELAALYPQSGGAYEYGYRLIHPAAGFAAGWMFLASKLSAAGAVAIGFGTCLGQLVPGIDPRFAAVVAAVLLTAANLFGIRKAGRLNTVIVGVTLLALLFFVVTGVPSFDAANLSPFAPAGWRGVAESAALLFFAYTGYARIATLGEEVENPEQTIPRAIIITIVVALALYLCVAIVAVGSIGATGMSASSSPLQAAARTFAQPATFWIVSLGAATAMLGVLVSQILGISRMFYAMARRSDLPAVLEKVSPRYGVPHAGIILSGIVIVAVALFGSLTPMVSAATFTILLYYAIANIAALRLPRAEKRYPRWIAGAGLAVCLLLAASLDMEAIVSGIGLLAAGFVLRMVVGGRGRERRT